MILNIDTATETASIALSDGTQVLELVINENQKDHAAWIHNAIRSAMDRAGRSLGELSAVAVTAGPGSYTGLRVGMATAKGLCYALNIPLITESTLKVMARAAVEFEEQVASESEPQLQDKITGLDRAQDKRITGFGSALENEKIITESESVQESEKINAQSDSLSKASFSEKTGKILLCPMIDARRMEVFAGVYTKDLEEIKKPAPVILDETSFNYLLADSQVIFFGTGSKKFRDLISNTNASFKDIRHHAGHLSFLSYESFRAGKLSNAAYADPVYLKEFYTHTRK